MYNSILLFLDFIEQVMIASILFQFIPVKETQKKVILSYAGLILLLFVLVRITNSIVFYEGAAIFIIVAILSIYMRWISGYNFGLIFVITGFVFCMVFLNATLTILIVPPLFHIEHMELHTNPSAYLLNVIISKILLALELAISVRFGRNKEYAFHSKKWISLVIVEILVFFILNIYTNHYVSGYNEALNALGILITLILFASELIVFQTLNQERQEKQDLKLILDKMDFEQKYYTDILSQYDEMRKIKHDFKHISDLLSELAVHNKTDEIIQILNSSEFFPLNKRSPVITGNHHLDYILNLKSEECLKRNLNLICTIEQNDLSFMKESDLYILIGNMIDNAIEHSSSSTHPITFKIFQKKQLLVITCSNPTSLPDTSSTNEVLKTSKKNQKNHGYGLASIQMIAQKYQGSCFYAIANQEFTMTAAFEYHPAS